VSNTEGKRKVKVIEVSGPPYEMGFQYGTACPDIRKMLDLTYQGLGGRDAAITLAEKYVPLYLPPTEAYAPEIVNEMKGIAAGAKVDFREIFFLNILYEISVHSSVGCTSFVASGEATSNGELIIGQNFDWLLMWAEIMVLLKMKPTEGPNVLAIAPAGSLGLFGLNSAGIGLNLNMLINKDSMSPTSGVPFHVILRKTLSNENVGEAIGTIASAKRGSAMNFILASDAGDSVDIEAILDDLDIHYPERGFLAHANHFETERFKSADLAHIAFPDTYVRSNRLATLMGRHWGSLSVDAMKALLQDHNNHPNSICRHPDPKAPLPMLRMMKTLISIISCPKERKTYIALGNPCENEYVEYQL